ncbi:MerR family transcriptional regulator [Roseicyclus marinus]|uniref:HTH merR-type domain-containing protein n=1 Tax=Roseicyclus marinus TaxID=2161673 RepID=A0AA48HHD0_9RHOB|nr:hypothetical protein MACH21_18060 [Roseicyclus marinus]
MSKSSQAFRTIREVADWLDVAAHVLRFWESKFPQIKPVKRAGGRRYYRPADMELVGGIKVLLHDRGMTIRGVQKMIREEGVAAIMALSPPVDLEDEDIVDGVDAPEAESDNWPETEAEVADDLPEDIQEDDKDDTADLTDAQDAMAPDASADDGADAEDIAAIPPRRDPVSPPAPKLSLVPPPHPPRQRNPPGNRQACSISTSTTRNRTTICSRATSPQATPPRATTANRFPRLPLPRTPNRLARSRMRGTAMSNRSTRTPPRCPIFCTG